mmetsp:Transcript_88793/g.256089  ORF Transcript_88793/g.256089 Transcript_88793/m.256089 type:complete len:203 (+) Transcript_88793:186-794(+)
MIRFSSVSDLHARVSRLLRPLLALLNILVLHFLLAEEAVGDPKGEASAKAPGARRRRRHALGGSASFSVMTAILGAVVDDDLAAVLLAAAARSREVALEVDADFLDPGQILAARELHEAPVRPMLPPRILEQPVRLPIQRAVADVCDCVRAEDRAHGFGVNAVSRGKEVLIHVEGGKEGIALYENFFHVTLALGSKNVDIRP